MVDTMPQGYPLWALHETVDGAPVVSYVVGWERAGYGSPWKPVLCAVDGFRAGDVMVESGGPRYFDHWGMALRAAGAMQEAARKAAESAAISPESAQEPSARG